MLCEFLNEYKVEKGCDYTHTSIKSPSGAYNIPLDARTHLMDLLADCVNNQIPVHLTEKNSIITPIKIDIDLKYQLGDKRRYDRKMIKQLVEVYNNAIKKYLPVDEFNTYVFTRDNPYDIKDITKDGIHIMYPHIVCDYQVQQLIRKEVLVEGKQLLSLFNCLDKHKHDDMIDEAVIKRNNWLMYGCSKPNVEPYRLTYVFNEQLETMAVSNDTRIMIECLTILDKQPTHTIKNEYKQLVINTPTTPSTPSTPSTPTIVYRSNITNTEFMEIQQLVNLLDITRADNYQKWLDIGLCLHHIEPSHKMLELWISFSKYSNTYKNGVCETKWSMFKDKQGGMSKGTLYFWIKNDNPTEFERLRNDSVNSLILKSLSKSTYDFALVVVKMFENEFKWTPVNKKVIYYFNNHRWCAVDDVVLNNLITNQVIPRYYDMIDIYNGKSRNSSSSDESKGYSTTIKFLMECINLCLKNISIREKIMKECCKLFYDDTFYDKLDANADLIGFNNGVYDLKNGIFRDGRPDDYISLSTNIDYKSYDETNPIIVDIYSFMSQVFPNDNVRDYVFVLLSSFLEGRNPKEKFHIWTGVGGNGKSKLLELFEKSFGEYTKKIAISVLTQKNKANSSSASPELARLKGARFISAQEPDAHETFNIGVIKEWSGNDKIVCRALYGEPFEYKPQYKMVVCCNQLPHLPADDEGIWRRVSVIEFKSRFVDNPQLPNEFKKDTYLSEKFDSWKEAFMYILLQHYKIYSENGLIEPNEVLDATKSYKASVDGIMEFLEENVKLTTEPNCYVKFKDLWSRYKKSPQQEKDIKMKEFKSMVEKKLGVKIPTQKTIDKVNVKSPIVGVEWIDADENPNNECVFEETE